MPEDVPCTTTRHTGESLTDFHARHEQDCLSLGDTKPWAGYPN